MYSRSEIHDKISSKYGKHGRIMLLSDTVLDKCDEWYTMNASNIKGKKNKQTGTQRLIGFHYARSECIKGR